MNADLDDLLGPLSVRSPSTTSAWSPQPQSADVTADVEDLLDFDELPDPGNFHKPVNLTFLAKVFGVETRRLHKKLAPCPVRGYGTSGRGKGQPLYDFREAITYIIKPKMDLGTYIRSLSSSADFPPHLSKAFWDGQNGKLRFMERARHYWHDEDVLEVLGRTAMEIKEATQLWIENLPGKATMSTEQYGAMQVNVTELLDSIHQRLVTVPAQRKTLAVVTTLEDEIAAAEQDFVG